MSAAAPVRCPRCGEVVFFLTYGLADAKCCGQRIQAERRTLDSDVRITLVDKPPRRMQLDSRGARASLSRRIAS